MVFCVRKVSIRFSKNLERSCITFLLVLFALLETSLNLTIQREVTVHHAMMVGDRGERAVHTPSAAID